MTKRTQKLLWMAALLVAAVPAWLANAQDPTAPPETRQTVTLPDMNPPVGTTMHSESTRALTAKIDLSMGGNVVQSIDQGEAESSVKDITIMKVDDEGEVTQIKIHYTSHDKIQSQNGMENAEPQAHVGKTYLATLGEDGKVAVTYAEGDEKPTSAEIDVIKKDAEDIVDGGIHELLPDRPLEIGEVIKPDLKKVREVMNMDDEKLELTEFSLSPVEIKDVDGQKRLGMKVHMKMSGEPLPGLKVSVEQSGMQWFDLETGAPLGGEVSGPLSISGSEALPNGQGQMDFGGGGTQKNATKNTIKLPE